MNTCSSGNCEQCPFGGPKVGYSGDIESPYVIVGESPGVHEVKAEAPFVGPSGQILWKDLPGIDRESVLVLNALRCKPPRKKDPKKMNRAANLCAPWVAAILSAYPRKAILTLGNFALHTVTGNSSLKITQCRGEIMSCPRTKAEVVPAVHPAALMRGTGNYRQFRSDLQTFLSIVNGSTDHLPSFIESSHLVIDARDPEQTDTIEISGPFVAADVETGGFNYLTDPLLCLAITDKEDLCYIYPTKDTENRDIEFIKPKLEDPNVRYIWHNGKFDIKFLWEEGIDARVDEDTMLLSYCLDEQPGIHDLERCMMDHLGAPNYKGMLDKYLPSKKASYEVIPEPVLHEYAGIDGSGTLQLFNKLRPRVAADPDLEKLYTQVLIPAVPMLARMERRGIRINPQEIDRVDKDLSRQIETLISDLRRLCDVHDLNPNSPKQLAKVMFGKLRLPRKRGTSTAAEVLDKLPQTRFVQKLKEYRKVAKLHSTYVKGIRRRLDESPDGRLHSTFLLHGTRTGRLASREPNLQNIPRGPLIRGMFEPEPGHVFIEIDLNQAELRCLALLSGDPFLCGIYRDSTRSLHHEVAVEFFGPDYTSEEKMRAKAVNFGIVYGREAPSLAYEFDISVQEAQTYIDAWFAKAAGAKEFIDKCRNAPRRGQTITTPFGRKKRHHIVSRENLRDLQNEASNFPHQSIASDIDLCAAVRCEKDLEAIGAHIVILVHDSIILECPDDPKIKAQAKRIAIDALESEAPRWGLADIPFTADTKEGYTWGTLKED